MPILKPVSQISYRLSMCLLVILLVGIIVSCDTNFPAPPQVTVNITMVENQNALNDAVNEALTATAAQNIHVTETILAQGGITLTPTPTSTYTLTPRPPTATPVLSPTPSDTPTITPTPTFSPFTTNPVSPLPGQA